MIKVKLSQIYNKQPYYTISNGKVGYNAIGVEQAFRIVKDIGKNKEKIDVESIEELLEEHNKLIKLLKKNKLLK